MFDDRPPNFMRCMVGEMGQRLYISEDYVIIWFNETNRRKIVLFLASIILGPRTGIVVGRQLGPPANQPEKLT